MQIASVIGSRFSDIPRNNGGNSAEVLFEGGNFREAVRFSLLDALCQQLYIQIESAPQVPQCLVYHLCVAGPRGCSWRCQREGCLADLPPQHLSLKSVVAKLFASVEGHILLNHSWLEASSTAHVCHTKIHSLKLLFRAKTKQGLARVG